MVSQIPPKVKYIIWYTKRPCVTELKIVYYHFLCKGYKTDDTFYVFFVQFELLDI